MLRLLAGGPGPDSLQQARFEGPRICECTCFRLAHYAKLTLRSRFQPYPYFVSGLGLFSTFAFASTLVHSGFVKLEHKDTVNWHFFLTKILPCGAATAGSHAFGNGAYIYITVAFVQMLKSFTPMVVLVMLATLNISHPTKEIVASVGLICVGTAISSYGEVNMNWIGFGFMVMAALSESTRLVLSQLLLQNLKFSAIEGQYFLIPGAAVCIFTASLILEGPTMLEKGHLAIPYNNPFPFFMCGIMGIAINYVSFLVIQYSNAVTMKVLGMVRNALLVMFTVMVQGEVVSSLQVLGYGVTLIAFGCYNYFQVRCMHEMRLFHSLIAVSNFFIQPTTNPIKITTNELHHQPIQT
jgi:hypothetical protein